MSSLTNLMHPYVSPCDFLHLLVLADTHLKNIYFHKLISTGPVVDINMQSVMDMEINMEKVRGQKRDGRKNYFTK